MFALFYTDSIESTKAVANRCLMYAAFTCILERHPFGSACQATLPKFTANLGALE